MIINYDKFPMLKMLDQNKPNMSVLKYEHDDRVFAPILTNLYSKWEEYSWLFKNNITLLSDEYYKSMSRSLKAFSGIDLSKETASTSGCLIFKSEGVYCSLLYLISDVYNMSIKCFYECDTIYADINIVDGKVYYELTKDEGIKGDLDDGAFINGTINNILCYLLMEKYAKVETKECGPNSKTKGGKRKDKIINYTGLKVNIRDCTWFTTICRSEGFRVRGHFRLQPRKNEKGEWTKELIYINEFEKHGYHRQAKIETIKSN